jgi:hypothetical protein
VNFQLLLWLCLACQEVSHLEKMVLRHALVVTAAHQDLLAVLGAEGEDIT